jgi:hypothetical protein
MAKKLFELLVVDGQLKTQAEQTRKDLQKTFADKRHLFEEKIKTFTSNEENAPTVTEEQSSIQTTVASELRWLADLWGKAIDTGYQIAHGNVGARADVMLDDGTVILRNVPALGLLELNTRMGEFQELLKAVPTLDPAKGFAPDEQRGKGYFKARDVRKPRTKKTQEPIVLYPHSPEHPAQTQLVPVDKVIGTIAEQEWSGLITPSRKADLLERVEAVRRAMKAALHRANATELTDDLPTCAKVLFDHVLRD